MDLVAHHASKWGAYVASAVAAAPVAYMTWRRFFSASAAPTAGEAKEASSKQSEVFGCTPQFYSRSHPAHAYMLEIYDRLYAGPQQQMFQSCVAIIDRLESMIIDIDDTTRPRAERVQMPVRAIEVLFSLKRAFARVIECTKETDPSTVKETALKENAKFVYDVMERRIGYISSRVQEIMMQSLQEKR